MKINLLTACIAFAVIMAATISATDDSSGTRHPAKVAETNQAEDCTLFVSSSPTGGVVEIDGKALGFTPLTRTVEIRVDDLIMLYKRITVYKPGYDFVDKHVEFSREERRLEVTCSLRGISDDLPPPQSTNSCLVFGRIALTSPVDLNTIVVVQDDSGEKQEAVWCDTDGYFVVPNLSKANSYRIAGCIFYQEYKPAGKVVGPPSSYPSKQSVGYVLNLGEFAVHIDNDGNVETTYKPGKESFDTDKTCKAVYSLPRLRLWLNVLPHKSDTATDMGK